MSAHKNTASGWQRRKTGGAPPAPKFVDHDELRGRWAYRHLFELTEEQIAEQGNSERELHRFKQMHYCARKIKTLNERYGARAPQQKDYAEFRRMHQRLRDAIASDNLGLVYDLYKRSRIVNVDGDELLSEGMMALTRAIDTFNPWRGFRFSTYACNAILRAFYRCGLKESKRRRHEPVNYEAELEKSDWSETQRADEEVLYAERLNKILVEGNVDLTTVERDVLAQRFPMREGTERRTLADIGRDMNLSKERVRQIQNSALGKLREALDLDPVLN
jgi:RNA polymerase primary sigma factor